MQLATKPCPFCGKEMHLAAMRCKHCKSYLDASAVPGGAAPSAMDRMLMPVGRPGSAIAAGYLGLFAIFPLIGIVAGALAFIFGVHALKKINADPELHGKGRAWFGIIVGGVFFVVQVIGGFLILNAAINEQRTSKTPRRMSEVLRVDPNASLGRCGWRA